MAVGLLIGVGVLIGGGGGRLVGVAVGSFVGTGIGELVGTGEAVGTGKKIYVPVIGGFTRSSVV